MRSIEDEERSDAARRVVSATALAINLDGCAALHKRIETSANGWGFFISTPVNENVRVRLNA